MIKIPKLRIADSLEFSIYLFCFTISSFPFVASMGFSLFLFVSALYIIITKPNIENLKKNYKAIIGFSGFFFICLISSFYSYSIHDSFIYLLKISPIVIVPMILFLLKESVKYRYSKILKAYVIGVLFTLISSFLYALWELITGIGLESVFYFNLVKLYNHHPTYVSIHLICVIIIVLLNAIDFKQRIKIMILTISIIFIFLLQVKIAVVCLAILLTIYLAKLKIVKRLKFLTLLLFISLLFMMSNYSKFRYNEFLVDYSKTEIGTFNENGVHERIWLWTEAIDQIKEKPIFGYGCKSQNKLFGWKIHKKILVSNNKIEFNNAVLPLTKYNLHNQFIQILYECGIFGLLIFITLSFFLFKIAIKQKKLIFILIYLSFVFFLFTENLLDRQMGIYFYAFILPLTFIDSRKTNKQQMN